MSGVIKCFTLLGITWPNFSVLMLCFVFSSAVF